MTARPHGYARYKIDGCRCYTCGFAVSQYRDRVDHAKRRGTWQPFVDAQPVREHVLQLKLAGVGERTIAALAGVDRKRVRELLHGRVERGTPPPEHIRPATAAALLSVELTLDVLPGNLLIDATGTHRRVQALAVNGWPLAQLGVRLGTNGGNLAHRFTVEQVTAAVARTSRALFDELWRADPREHGVGKQAYARAVNQARANGWAPAGAWDEDAIDDPAGLPDWTGACGSEEGWLAHRAEAIPVCGRCAPFASKRRPAALRPCGTLAAYRRHLRRGETPCAACAAANRDDIRNRACVA